MKKKKCNYPETDDGKAVTRGQFCTYFLKHYCIILKRKTMLLFKDFCNKTNALNSWRHSFQNGGDNFCLFRPSSSSQGSAGGLAYFYCQTPVKPLSHSSQILARIEQRFSCSVKNVAQLAWNELFKSHHFFDSAFHLRASFYLKENETEVKYRHTHWQPKSSQLTLEI